MKSLCDFKHAEILSFLGCSAESQSTAKVLRRYPTVSQPDMSAGLRQILPVFVPSQWEHSNEVKTVNKGGILVFHMSMCAGERLRCVMEVKMVHSVY